jgi:ACS family hexuronate transporter-like MFS transporter
MSQRWWVAVCLFLATVINYVDRQTLSVLAPVLTDELKITNVEYSYMVQAFLIPYTFMYIPAGILIDRWGTRAGMAVSMAWWSIATALHGAASNARHLIIYRFLLGVGESGNFLAAEKAVSEWYPPKERGVANGLINAAAGVGAIIAPPIIVAIWHIFGWRWAFAYTGLLGFIWLGPWMRVYRNPPQAPSRDRKGAVPWTDLLRHPQTWGLLFARVLADPVWWFYLFWLPKYLKEARGFTMTQIGSLSWIPYVASDAGSILGGVFSGWLVRRHLPIQARRLAMWPCVLLMPLGILIAFTPSSVAAFALISLATFCHMAWKTNLMTLTNDVYPPGILASAAGLVGLGGGLGGAIAAPVFGRLIDAFSYTPVFIIMGFLHPAAMLVVHFAVRKPICELSPVSAARA